MLQVDPTPSPIVAVGKARFGNALPLALIAGPCALESRDHAIEMASALKEIAGRVGIELVYKTSFDKANRTSANSARGIGLERALTIFAKSAEARRADPHRRARRAAMRAGGAGGRRPADSCFPVPADRSAGCGGGDRPRDQREEGPVPGALGHGTRGRQDHRRGNPNVLVTERGASFGYNTLISDMRALPILARTTGAPVIFDATHSVQQPGGQGPRAASANSSRRWRGRRSRSGSPACSSRPTRIRTGRLRRPQHDAAQGNGGLLRRLVEFDRLAKTPAIKK